MVINFQGVIDPISIRKTVALMSKPPLWLLAVRVGIAILILATLGALIFSYFSGEPVTGSRVIRLVIQDVVLGYFLIQPYIAARQLYKRLSAGDQYVAGTIDPIGVSYKASENRGTGSSPATDYPWDSFHHVYKAEGLVVLATADYRLVVLPRSLFENEQDWQHFRQYVDSRVVPTK